ncbi:MAG: hypothetical protein NTY81_00930 [Candidatus Staskawiczbacteria bacterium]|nr:hypothetical protein [Candidatus Staskawiczbacteria bacterium]
MKANEAVDALKKGTGLVAFRPSWEKGEYLFVTGGNGSAWDVHDTFKKPRTQKQMLADAEANDWRVQLLV